VAILLNRLAEEDPGLLALHAGAVTFGGQAIIFPSTHRAGKSTLAAALSLNGHKLVAEDILPLDCNGAEAVAVASGVAPRLRLPLPAALGLGFRLSARRFAGPDDGHYRYLRLPQQSRCRFGGRFEIGAFVFLERDLAHCEPQLMAVGKTDAMRILLLQNFGVAAPPEAILDRMDALTSRRPAFLLRYSNLGKAVARLRAGFDSGESLVGLWRGLKSASPDLERVAGVCPQERPVADDSDRIVCRREGVVVRQAESSTFLADPANGGIFALDPVGVAIWHLLERPVGVDDIAARLCAAYPDVAPATIAADVRRLIQQFVEHRLAAEIVQSARHEAQRISASARASSSPERGAPASMAER
jgi:hypothetical protein